MSQQAPFVIQPFLTQIALTYRNRKLIADSVLPRIPVESSTFKYSKYNKADAFTVPNTKVGRKGKVAEIDWSATEATSATDDYGLEDAIPYSDIRNAQSVPTTPIDPQARSTELLTDLIGLDREIRTAALVFGAANYGASTHDVSDTATDQWDNFDPNTLSNPIDQITAVLDAMLIRPNTFVLGRAVATKLRQHPRIVKSYNATAGDQGIVPIDYLASLFELDQILVGDGWVNTAKKGQAPSMARAWGNHAALLNINPLVTGPQAGVTFGFTAEWGTRTAGSRVDPDIGLRGGTRVRVGESVKELIVASDVGYLFENAIAG